MAFQFTSSYTSIKEFTPSFPKTQLPAFEQPSAEPTPEWQPHPPYPEFYTQDYRKTILSTL